MMQVLPPSKYQNIIPLKEAASTQFPLINAVIEGQQEGGIYVDQVEAPNAAFVYHKFGFSTLLGDDQSGNFEDDLKELFFTQSSFPIKYFHWYDPPDKWQNIMSDSILKQNYKDRQRTQFTFDQAQCRAKTFGLAMPEEYEARDLDNALLKEAEVFALDLGNRFWSSGEHLLEEGIGICGIWNGQLASICYSSTTAKKIAEVDVSTLASMKGKHLGTFTTYFFIQKCLEYNILPNWDCFDTNTPSFRIAQKLGFVPSYHYRMLSIYRYFL